MADYSATRDRVEQYFDRSATKVWERLTSDAPVSRIRQTVREGRDRMRAIMLARLPEDLRGCRVLDAGCGTGLMTAELAARGAEVVAVDISPQLIGIAKARLPQTLAPRVTFAAGDMTDAAHGSFDFEIFGHIWIQQVNFVENCYNGSINGINVGQDLNDGTLLLFPHWIRHIHNMNQHIGLADFFKRCSKGSYQLSGQFLNKSYCVGQ